MTKDQIEDYLYFFLAPLLSANEISNNDLDDLKRMVILTMSQSAVYIEAPAYAPGVSSREYTNDVKNEISGLTNKILATIPERTTDQTFWLNLSISELLPDIRFTDTQLQAEQSFGPYKTETDKYYVFDFHQLAYQLQLQLPNTVQVSAVLSTRKPINIPDGAITNLDIDECALWISTIQLNQAAADTTFYTPVQLKRCNILFDAGYNKSGNKIGAGLHHSFSGFLISCIPENEIPAVVSNTVAAGNTITYPGKFVFSFSNRPDLPQLSKATLTHAEPFSATLFGSTLSTLTGTNINGNWQAAKNMLAFALQTEQSVFAATTNTSPVFDLKGRGEISDPAWYFPVVSINHPLGLARLGIASECGYLGFNIKDQFTLSWNGLENGPLKLQHFFVLTSPGSLRINYTSVASMLAKQQLKLWTAVENQKAYSVVGLNYNNAASGNFISHRQTSEVNITGAKVDVNIDRPRLSNGDRIFLKTSGGLMLFNDGREITAAVVGSRMDPSVAFENKAYKSLFSFALSNALILVRPVDVFVVAGRLSSGVITGGRCIIKFPVVDIEHILPDPYTSNLFGEQPGRDNVAAANSLHVTVKWDEDNNTQLILELADEQGNVFKPKASFTDEQLADRLLFFPLQHPGEKQYEDFLRNALATAGIRDINVVGDTTPYSKYQSSYHSKTNTTGAYATLHILPGDVALADVSGRASQMGVSFYRKLDNTENGRLEVLSNTGYTTTRMFRIENNELVSSGRFVRAFTLPHVQWEPVYFEDPDSGLGSEKLFQKSYFPTHGVPTRIASANKTDVALAPLPVAKYIVDSFHDEKNKYAAAAHFALPSGMNAIALFHPKVKDFEPPPIPLHSALIPDADPYSYSILNFNQPVFDFQKALLSGAIQINALSEGYPKINRDERRLPDPSFHGAVLQMPNGFKITKDGVNIICKDDSILGEIVTPQFNKVMWGEYLSNGNSLNFRRSGNAKVPLRRIDFSGFGASVFSNWLNKYAGAGSVSQVQFNILIGRVAHEVVQIKSVIIPWFVPVVRTIIIERKNHANIIRTDTGWIATGPGEFHDGYDWHPGVIKGVYNVTTIRDTEITLKTTVKGGAADMAGVYFDGDIMIEHVEHGFKTEPPKIGDYRAIPSKKQFGYILLGNPDGNIKLQNYLRPGDLNQFLSRPDVGSLGGPVDCIVNIAGSDQMMHITKVDVTAAVVGGGPAFVGAAKGTLQLPKGGSWSVVKKVTGGVTSPLTNDETVPLIRHGSLKFTVSGNQNGVSYNGSRHVLGNPHNVDKYVAGSTALADTEYALLQSTDTHKLLFPRPSFNSGLKKIFTTNPLIADPYSLLKGNAIFPTGGDALKLGSKDFEVESLDVIKKGAGISFPTSPVNVAALLEKFIPPEIEVGGRKLFLVQEENFKVYIDYGGSALNPTKQLFNVALNGNDDNKRWQMVNTDVAIVVELADFKPLLTIKGKFTTEAGAKPKFNDATIQWGDDPKLQKIIQVLSILYMLANNGETKDFIKEGFSFVMGNSPDTWSYKCTIEERIPVIQFPNSLQLAQLPVPAPLIIQAGLNLGIFFNLSLSTEPNNLIKAGAGVVLGFEATIQVLLITVQAITAYGVGTAKIEIFIELPEAKPTFKFTMGFGATVAVQLPMVGYVSLTRVISLGASIDSNGAEMTVGQLLKGVLTIGGGLASVGVQVEASGTVSNKGKPAPDSEWTATVRGVFTLDVTVAFVFSWDFSKAFEHEVDLPNPF